MPTRTIALHGFTIEAARQKPVAVVDPSAVSRVIGALVRLSGRSSSAPDNAPLSYTWSFESVPLGSTVTDLIIVEEDGGVATFVPDVTGQYVVRLVASTPYRDSDPVLATVLITSAQTPVLTRTTPDGRIMFDVLSSFWTLVERNAVFSTIWSGYMQLVANDLLRLFQVDAGKSISTLQSMAQRRWLDYSPALSLDAGKCTGVFGYHQSGGGAFTASSTVASAGVIITSREVVLVDGAPTLDAAGTILSVYTSAGSPGNTGEYLIERLNSDSSGYVVSSSTPFPAPDDELLASGTTLVTFRSSAEVYDATVGVNFASAGVEVGDVLRLSTGSDAGYYVVEAVGLADGLANNRTMRLDRAPTQTLAGRAYSVHSRSRLSAKKAASASTDVVYIPASEADFTAYEARVLSGRGTVVGPYEIAVEARHVLPAMVGSTLSITSGSASGRNLTITGVNAAGTGYLVGVSMGGTRFPYDVAYATTSRTDASDRLLVLDGEAYGILTAELSAGVPEEDGGRGAVWVVTLDAATAPSGREELEWRIGASLSTSEFDDLEALGVTAGDLLVLEVTRADSPFVSTLLCSVLGSRGRRIAFDFGTAALASGANGSLSDADVLRLAGDLKIPSTGTGVDGSLVLDDVAAEVKTFLESTTFLARYANVPLSSSTEIDLDGAFAVRVSSVRVVRNCRMPVDASLVSVPSLFEYIDTPAYGTRDGSPVLVGKYGDLVELDREPLELLENRDYTISSEESVTGTNLETVAASSILRIPGGALIDRDLRVGDYVELTSGLDVGRYFVRAVVDDERVQVADDDGRVPSATATGVSYRLRRRTAGHFLRFVDGMFTPSLPAPERFWAQLSLFDNASAIEDNFGVLVGVTKEQLDEFGSSQVSYRGAIQALMYAWTSGPTIKNVTVGTHILTGLPVTEVRGRIVQIDDPYDEATGRSRVLVEDITAEGTGTGIVRAYYFATDDAGGLDTFQGLATNPATGRAFAVLDVVEAFSPLSRGISVSDYLTSPEWWNAGDDRVASELQKFHTWQVRVDASQVDSRDVGLVDDFVMGIRPVYTKPRVVLVMYLHDEVTVEDTLLLGVTDFAEDDPALSIEATHELDSYNGSSLPMRVLDAGSLATRTLFEGDDLVTVAGSGVVTSARGGFIGGSTVDPLDHAPGEELRELPYANAAFSTPILYRGYDLVRSGDLLFIRSGPNRGRYEVLSVDGDGQLTVGESAMPPTSRPPTEIEAGTSQVFQIQRVDSATLTSGSGTVRSTSGAGDDVVSVVEAPGGNFRWSGVAVGDVLLVSNAAGAGPDADGPHEILQVGEWDGGVVTNRDTRLTVRGSMTEDGTFDYEVVREGLRLNPILETADVVLTNGSGVVSSATTDFDLALVRAGDRVEFLSGTYEGASFSILDWSNTDAYLDFESSVSETGVSVRVVRPSLVGLGETEDSDADLAVLWPDDAASLTIVDPRALVLSVVDLVLSTDTSDPDPANWVSTAESATDFAAGGVLAGDHVEIENAALNSGSRALTLVSTTTLTIDGLWRGDEGPVAAALYRDDDAWTVMSDTAELAGTDNLEFGPMVLTSTPEAGGVTVTGGSDAVTGIGTSFLSTLEVGSVVRFPGDGDLSWAVVANIASDTALTLDRNYTDVGGVGGLELGVPGGLVRVGDTFELDGVGSFVVRRVRGAVLTFTRDTGVAVPANYTGRVKRTT